MNPIYPKILIKTVDVTDNGRNPQRLSETPICFRRALVFGRHGVRNNGPNSGPCWIGTSPSFGVNSLIVERDGQQGEGPDIWHQGVPLDVPAGEISDLSHFYVEVDSEGDGVLVLYWE